MNKNNIMEDMKSAESVGFISRLKDAIRKVVDVILYII